MIPSAELVLERLPTAEGSGREARRLLARTAATVADEVDDVARNVAQIVLEAVDDLRDDPSTRADTECRAREGILAFCDLVTRGGPPETFAVAPGAYGFARILARRGVHVSVLLRTHRLALAVVLDAFEQRLDRSESKATLMDAARLVTDLGFAAHDVLSREVCGEYDREREDWTHGARAIRRETVEAILAEQAVDPDHASRALCYELRRHHVGLVVFGSPAPDASACTPATLKAAADRVAAELGGGRPLLIQPSSREMWGWVGTERPLKPEALDALSRICLADGVRVAMGDCAHGIAGFRRTHREAADTARVATLGVKRAGSITSYHAVELAAFMADDVARTRNFVQNQLGPLARDDEDRARLRVTLMLYLEEHGSRIATARRLGIHPNTVANRVRSCREQLDRDLSHQQVQLQVALSLAATLGSAVLSPGHKQS